VLERLNRLILDEGPRARFITLVHGELIAVRDGCYPGSSARAGAARTGAIAGGATHRGAGSAGAAASGSRRQAVTRVSLVCAGHPLPLLLRAGAKPVLATSPQPLLGVLDDVAFRSKTVDLEPGDVLLCVTDGVTERRHAGQLLDDNDGLSQLFAECAGLNAGAIAARILRAVRNFAPQPPADDLALIVMRAL